MCICRKTLILSIGLLILLSALDTLAKPLDTVIAVSNKPPSNNTHMESIVKRDLFGDLLDSLWDELFSDEDDSDEDKYLICRNCTVVINKEQQASEMMMSPAEVNGALAANSKPETNPPNTPAENTKPAANSEPAANAAPAAIGEPAANAAPAASSEPAVPPVDTQ